MGHGEELSDYERGKIEAFHESGLSHYITT